MNQKNTTEPEIVLGTMTFGDTVDEATSERIFHAALDAGITHIDTANVYVQGRTEELLSQFLTTTRDNVFLASKVGIPHPDAKGHSPLSAPAVRQCVEASLRRLKTDRLDLLYLHQPDNAANYAETLSEVAKLHAEGKILSFGVSNFAAWQIAQLRHLCRETGAPEIVVAQQVYSLVARKIENEYLPYAENTNLRTLVYNPLAGGILTGKYSYKEHPQHGRFGDAAVASMYSTRYWNESVFEAVAELSRIAAESDMTLTELALRWVAFHEQIDGVLLGGSKLEHLRSNIDALRGGVLPTDVAQAASAATEKLHGPMPNYQR